MDNKTVRRLVDGCMTVLLMCLMAYQVTGETLHEWVGIGMTLLVIVHQILNRRWYASLFRGRYNLYRTVSTAINVLLIASFLLTAFCGMSMSGHAVPFLYGMLPVSFARRMHLSMSHWAFVLMGMHLGMHIRAMLAAVRWTDKMRKACSAAFCIMAGLGLWLFIKSNMPAYLFFRTPFAMLDYDTAGVFIFLENFAMLLFWAFLGNLLSLLISTRRSTDV